MDLSSDRPPPRAPLPKRARDPLTIDGRVSEAPRPRRRAALALAVTVSVFGAALGLALAPAGRVPVKAAWQLFNRALADTGASR